MIATAIADHEHLPEQAPAARGAPSAEQAAARRRSRSISIGHQRTNPSRKSERFPASARQLLHQICNSCNKCFMAEPAKSSPLSELRIALPSLPMRLQEVGRFVAANDYDATTRSMRDLAAVAGADPAAFTRLAKAIGYSGWDELRAALTQARRPSQTSPFSVRAKAAAHGPNADARARHRQVRGRGRRPSAHSGAADCGSGPRAARRPSGSGSPAIEAAAAWRIC